MAPTSKNSGFKRKSSPRKQYHSEELERAIEEERKTGKMRRAAKMFHVHVHVPFSTVQRYIRTPPKGQKPGPGTVLTAEEEARIKTWVTTAGKGKQPSSAEEEKEDSDA